MCPWKKERSCGGSWPEGTSVSGFIRGGDGGRWERREGRGGD